MYIKGMYVHTLTVSRRGQFFRALTSTISLQICAAVLLTLLSELEVLGHISFVSKLINSRIVQLNRNFWQTIHNQLQYLIPFVSICRLHFTSRPVFPHVYIHIHSVYLCRYSINIDSLCLIKAFPFCTLFIISFTVQRFLIAPPTQHCNLKLMGILATSFLLLFLFRPLFNFMKLRSSWKRKSKVYFLIVRQG